MPMSRLFAGTRGDVLAVDQRRCPASALEPGEDAQRGGLAAPGRPSSATSSPGSRSRSSPSRARTVAVGGAAPRSRRRRRCGCDAVASDRSAVLGARCAAVVLPAAGRASDRPAAGRSETRVRQRPPPRTSARRSCRAATITTWRCRGSSSEAIVYSPRTSAIERNDAERIRGADVGQMTAHDDARPARPECARGLHQGAEVDGRTARRLSPGTRRAAPAPCTTKSA